MRAAAAPANGGLFAADDDERQIRELRQISLQTHAQETSAKGGRRTVSSGSLFCAGLASRRVYKVAPQKALLVPSD